MLASRDQAVIWKLACDFFRSLGFEQVLYGYSPDSRGQKLGAPEDFLILSTMPKAVITELVEQGYFRMSCTFHWALENTGIASWSMSYEEAGLADQMDIRPEGLDFFARHDLVNGCCIGFPKERTRGRGVMALIAPAVVSQEEVDRLLADLHDVIFSVASVAHKSLSILPYHESGRRLSKRQREVLEWVADGKTSADIAMIMGITVSTVEKHLRLARETLGVETTAHAISKAAYLNQVFVASPAEHGTMTTISAWDA
ncbi:helix-turn-helix transcriptional regulator [Rhodobacter sp. NTK016B]|uniref:helix-turn-helix transcriptional regulator n=1 Tax=Rhodobacter sp. NTK016B TaxID=2759676 RepID=UPI001A8D8FBD|nr:LuxR family transcriptional regulator [Rhodobacter sp. NTK016B]